MYISRAILNNESRFINKDSGTFGISSTFILRGKCSIAKEVFSNKLHVEGQRYVMSQNICYGEELVLGRKRNFLTVSVIFKRE